MCNYLASFIKSVLSAVNFNLMVYFVSTCPWKHLVMHVVYISPCGGAIVCEFWKKKKHYLILGHHQCPLILPYESNKNSLNVDSTLEQMQICVQLFLCNYSPDTHLLITSVWNLIHTGKTKVVLRRDSAHSLFCSFLPSNKYIALQCPITGSGSSSSNSSSNSWGSWFGCPDWAGLGWCRGVWCSWLVSSV